MKTRFLLSAIVAMMSFLTSSRVLAQDNNIDFTEETIPWKNYAISLEEAVASGEQVYLYAPAQPATNGKAGFLTMAGPYGVYGIINDAGQRLKIENYLNFVGQYAVQTSCHYAQDKGKSGYLAWTAGENMVTLDRDLYEYDDSRFKTVWSFIPTSETINVDGESKTVYGYQLSTGNYEYQTVVNSQRKNGQYYVTSITITATPAAPNFLGYDYEAEYEKAIYGVDGSKVSTQTRTKTITIQPNLGPYSDDWDAYTNAMEATKTDPTLKPVYETAMAELRSECEAGSGTVSVPAGAVMWYILSYDSYLSLLLAQSGQTYVNVTGLLYDPNFERNNKYKSSWEWQGDDDGYYMGFHQSLDEGIVYPGPVVENAAAFYCAEVSGSGMLTQTVTVPKPGLYAISCQGFYVGNGANSNSYLYAQSGSNSEQILLSDLTATDVDEFYYECTDLQSMFAGGYEEYYQPNVAAGAFLAEWDRYAPAGLIYSNRLIIRVDAMEGEEGPLTITLGVNKTSTDGSAYVDNFKLFYIGEPEILFDERLEEQDDKMYEFSATLNLRRTFTLNAWNPIILPMSLTGEQVKKAFGSSDAPARLSVLESLTQSTWGTGSSYCINFEKVDLDKDGIEPGKCYIVWVTKGPNIEKGVTYQMPINATETLPVTGPIYQFMIDGQEAYESTIPVEGISPDECINYVGYYGKQTTGYKKGDFIMDKGEMYHLDQNWGSVKYASEWKLTIPAIDPVAPVKFTMSINDKDEGEATSIIDVMVMNEPVFNSHNNTDIYNVSGQKVSGNINTLPKGIYFKDGRKFIVK